MKKVDIVRSRIDNSYCTTDQDAIQYYIGRRVAPWFFAAEVVTIALLWITGSEFKFNMVGWFVYGIIFFFIFLYSFADYSTYKDYWQKKESEEKKMAENY
ncbi:hypothetical protein BN938_0624 [Mucinivorans hirudinis]|uniref:Uncharacterized protein n=1 Tax=Mucinivorans hirudinis TaxID=1433126 RepID=A0A060RBF8_9BACT|nr:hypothetical protein BN938_0624 [Mucinivorans hirudinis]